MRVCIVENPRWSPDWGRFVNLLDEAMQRGGLNEILAPYELLWAVYEGSEPIAAATARLTVEDVAEVVLVGGKDHRKWLHELSEAIGACAAAAGATHLRAFGRRGWRKALTAKGWAVIGEDNGFVGYERELA